eukprot:11100039-Heterocapsa_arctica.AAC.1
MVFRVVRRFYKVDAIVLRSVKRVERGSTRVYRGFQYYTKLYCAVLYCTILGGRMRFPRGAPVRRAPVG